MNTSTSAIDLELERCLVCGCVVDRVGSYRGSSYLPDWLVGRVCAGHCYKMLGEAAKRLGFRLAVESWREGNSGNFGKLLLRIAKELKEEDLEDRDEKKKKRIKEIEDRLDREERQQKQLARIDKRAKRLARGTKARAIKPDAEGEAEKGKSKSGSKSKSGDKSKSTLLSLANANRGMSAQVFYDTYKYELDDMLAQLGRSEQTEEEQTKVGGEIKEDTPVFEVLLITEISCSPLLDMGVLIRRVQDMMETNKLKRDLTWGEYLRGERR